MRPRSVALGTAVLVALAVSGAACSTGDDVVGVSADTEPANSDATETAVPGSIQTEPAATNGASTDGFVFLRAD